MQRQREIIVDNYQITSKTIDAAFRKAKMQNKTNLVLAQTFRLLNLNKLFQSSPSDSSIKQAIKSIVDSSFIPSTSEPSFNTMPFDLSEIFPLNKLGNFGRVLQRKCRIVQKGVMQFQDEKQQPKLKELKNFVNIIQRFGQPQNDNKIGWLSEQKKYPFRIILIDKNDGHKGLYFTNFQKAQQIRIALSQNYRLNSKFVNIMSSVSSILLKTTGESFKKKIVSMSNSLNKGSRFSRKVNIGATYMKQPQLIQGDSNESLVSKLALQSKKRNPQSQLKARQDDGMFIIPGLLQSAEQSEVQNHFRNVNDSDTIDFLALWNTKAQMQAKMTKKAIESPVYTPNNSRIKVSQFEQNSNNLNKSGFRKQPTLLKAQHQKSKNKQQFQKLINSNFREKNSEFKQKDSYIKQISQGNGELPSIEFYTIQFMTLSSLFFKPIVTFELIRNNKVQQNIIMNTIIKRKDPYLCYQLLKSGDDESLMLNGNLNQYQISVKVIDFLANEQVVNDKLTLKNRLIRDKVCIVCDGKLIQLQLQLRRQLMKSNKVERSYQEEVINIQVKIPSLTQETKQKINQYWEHQSQSQGYYNQTNLTIYRILSQIEITPLTWWKDIEEDQYQLLQVVYTASKILGFKMIRSFPHILEVFIRMFPNLQQMIEKLISFILTFLKVYYFPEYLNRLQKFHRLLGLDEDCQFISKVNLQMMVMERIVEMQCPMLVSKLNRKNISYGYKMMEYIYEAYSRNFTVNQLAELWNYLYQDIQFLQLNMVMIAIAIIKFYQEDLMRAKRLTQFAGVLQNKKINRLQFIISQIESLKEKYFGQTRGILDQIKRIFNSKPLEPVLFQFYKRETSKLDERKKNRILEKKVNLRKVNKQIDIQFPQYPKKHYTLHLYFMKLPQIGGSITIKCNDVDYQCLNHQKNKYFIISQVSNKVTVNFLDVKSNEYSCQLIFTQGIHQQSCYLTSVRNSVVHKITYLAGLLTDSQIQIFKKGRKFDQFISPFVKTNDIIEEMNRPLHQTLFLKKYDNNSSKDDLVKRIKGLFCSGNKVFNQIEFYIEQIQTSNLTLQQKIFHVRDLARTFSEQFCLCQNQTLEKHLIRHFFESSGYQISPKQFECFYNDSLQYEFDGPKILKCRFLPHQHSIRELKLQVQVLNYFINKSTNYLYPDIIIDELMQVIKFSINQQLGNLHEGELKLSYSSGGEVYLKCWQLKLKNKNKQMYYEQFKQDTSQQIEPIQIGEPELLMTEVLPSFAKISTILDYVNTNRNLDLKTKYQDKQRRKLAEPINLLKQCQTKFNKVILMRYLMYPQNLNMPFFNYYYELTHDFSTPVIKTMFLNNLKTDLKTICLFKGQLKYGQNSKIQSFTYSSDLGLYGNLRLMSNDAKGWFFFGSAKDDHGKQKHDAKVFFNYGYGIFRWQKCQVLGFTKRLKQSKIIKPGSNQKQQQKISYLILIRGQERYVKEYQLQISPQTLSKIEEIGESTPRIIKRQPTHLEQNEEESQIGLKYLSKFIK